MSTSLTKRKVLDVAIDMYVIGLDRTRHFDIDISDRPFIDRIIYIYVFDRNRHVHACELTPSYEMLLVSINVHFKREYHLTERRRDEIIDKYEQVGDDDCTYFHVSDIDKIIDRYERYLAIADTIKGHLKHLSEDDPDHKLFDPVINRCRNAALVLRCGDPFEDTDTLEDFSDREEYYEAIIDHLIEKFRSNVPF